MNQISRVCLFIACATLLIAPHGRTEDIRQDPADLPQIVQRGLSAFDVNGGETAVKNWTRGGPLEHSRGEEAEIIAIRKLEKLYGQFQGHSVIEQVDLGPASTLIFLEIQLEDGPIYIKFHLYDGRSGERVVGLEIDAVPERILPPYVLENRSRRPAPRP